MVAGELGEVQDWRQEWFAIEDATYLNFATHGVTPCMALGALQASIEAKKRPHIVDDAMFFRLGDNLRASLARLIGASTDEIALTSGAGAGAMTVAYALAWKPGDEVILAGGEFPTHYATWKPMEQRHGILLKVVDAQSQFLEADDLISAITPRTRLISVSHVRFDDGSLLDAARLAAACRKNGTLLLLDVSQSCGAIPIDVRQIGADFVICAGYKYLLSPWGTGFLWARKELLGSLQAAPYNWLSQGLETMANLNYIDPGPSRTMSRWDAAEAASLFNFNLTVMEASVRFVLRADPARVRDHGQRLIDHLFDRLPEGCRPASPRQRDRRGVFGCIDAGNRTATEALYRKLRARNFVVALREGRIRIAPHLLNSIEEIERLRATIAEDPRGASNVTH
jgi:cysteine desulfurase / selenocysteine lyase